ncbi:MAG: magnesium-translocating P-type ATPase, partial [Clostridiales bacterium]|nr:magnesium-translocating P-type ATPase [Clostridiales bacterium]
MPKFNNTPAIARLLEASKSDVNNLLVQYNTSTLGHSEQEAEVMEEQYGKNIVTFKSENTILKRLYNSFINPFNIVLLLLACVTYITDKSDFFSIIIVVSMIFLSGILHFVQETRSNSASEKLTSLISTTATVVRKDTGTNELPFEDIVVGDIILLAAGDMLPADVRLISAKDLFISQSSLTGESEPQEKFVEISDEDETNPLEQENLAFMGTTVVSGSAMAIVIATGSETYFGSMSRSIAQTKVVTSFEKGVRQVSWLLIRFMLVMVPIILLVNGFTKGDWLSAVLFALSVAVGLTPEMLPMIVTTNLARGAVNMSNEQTIVKSLSSIQNFGAMDVLCTDKTGTLTQDRVILEYHLDIHGNNDTDDRILRHAFLNSYNQTGLKNLMDIAILEHAQDYGMRDLTTKYHKVDEIPFDFNRRRMSVVVEDFNGKTQLITKGAVEEMLQVCSFAEYKGGIEPLTNDIKAEIMQTVQGLNEQGMRVIAIAQKTNPPSTDAFSIDDESDMVLMGYLAFLDPPKESAMQAIEKLNEYGIDIKVLTGDNDAVTACICRQVGIKVDEILLGTDVEDMPDDELYEAVERVNVFAKLSPQQKARIVLALRNNNHIVGFMGDGINDAYAMKNSDVGISVDSAVDIAKESADIILLEKSLMVLEKGVVEGRKTFGNIMKYIKMTVSSNFGNMLSVLIASAFLPFLPMQPIQLLLLNLIYDISCISIPWDNIDKEYLVKPRKWGAKSILKFMLRVDRKS